MLGVTDLQRTTLALECLGDAVVVADAHEKLVFVNSAFERLLGYSKSELTGQDSERIVPPDSFEVTTQMVRDAANEKWEGEAHRLHKSGESLPVHLVATLVRGGDGEIIGRVTIIRSLDDEMKKPSYRKWRQAAERQHAKEKMEAIEQLAGGIAHNFNNLLTPILGYAQLGERALPESSHVRSYLREISKAAIRAATLTRQLLAFSRRQPIEPEVIDLNEFLIGMQDSVRELAGDKVELVLKLSDGLDSIKVDIRQMQRLLMNLVSNARDAMANGGVLTIETSNVMRRTRTHDGTAAQCVMLSVSDTGAGMAEHVRARAFEPFFTTKGLDRGAGLGLSTCYGIVTQSGGAIEVESEEGQGATVSIYLPRADEYLGSGAVEAREAIGS
ncbi:MAG: ATP-binding protein [Chloroflexi bacterium]|nr:ATP-binding protein [Chloroflexota bacterium]